ncbi:SRPBCC family protein [Aquimarina sp. D1M17]|uniref:SRPBCC family protein n=1 Tax=Aquimarina acroporae TaxID=2937283 RepID=UPI0020BDBCF6|nr:SRPBCC family protein [Aquimarina acroporae]MCK8521624.1 SRPBCC family protein [Aquimarina acroporae]
MTTIRLKTEIKAPLEIVFDASRDIDLHIESTSTSNEKAIAGRTSGLIKLNETVTWKGKHFGMYLTHQSKITAFNFPFNFTDEMMKGHFKSFKHQHIFKPSSNNTIMTDILTYQTPYGYAGKLFDTLFLKKYLTNFLLTRNHYIKTHVETS